MQNAEDDNGKDIADTYQLLNSSNLLRPCIENNISDGGVDDTLNTTTDTLNVTGETYDEDGKGFV